MLAPAVNRPLRAILVFPAFPRRNAAPLSQFFTAQSVIPGKVDCPAFPHLPHFAAIIYIEKNCYVFHGLPHFPYFPSMSCAICSGVGIIEQSSRSMGSSATSL